MSVDPIVVTEADLPQQVGNALKTHGDGPKNALARAAVPMPPADLVASLVCLSRDKDPEIASTAAATLGDISFGVLQDGIVNTKSPAVLDALLRSGKLDSDLQIDALRNPNCDDRSFEYMAEKGRGPVLNVIAENQLRYVRHPQIVKALYYNPGAGMDVVSRVVETAVRAGADLSIIPGWEQIVESIVGAEFVKGPQAKVQPEEPPPEEPQEAPQEPAKPAVPVEVTDTGEPLDELVRDALDEVDQGSDQGVDAVDTGSDDDFLMVLLRSAQESESSDEATEDQEEEEEDRSLWMKIEHMTVPQKVRLALVGSAFARSILIHDQRRPVFMAVLESPKLSENEIVSFASDKSLSEELIRRISRNREWVRLYSVKRALVMNPKTPPITAMQLLSYLSKRELKILSKSHDVPGYISRKARQLAQKGKQD